jgi:hypothetical protein
MKGSTMHRNKNELEAQRRMYQQICAEFDAFWNSLYNPTTLAKIEQQMAPIRRDMALAATAHLNDMFRPKGIILPYRASALFAQRSARVKVRGRVRAGNLFAV